MQMPQRAENYYYYSNYPNYQHEYSTCTMDYNKMETEALIKGLFYVYFVKQFLGQTGKGLVLNSFWFLKTFLLSNFILYIDSLTVYYFIYTFRSLQVGCYLILKIRDMIFFIFMALIKCKAWSQKLFKILISIPTNEYVFTLNTCNRLSSNVTFATKEYNCIKFS